MDLFNQLQPREVWNYFSQILTVPRRSRKEEQIIGFLTGFAKELGLACRKDHAGNLVVTKPASPGMDSRKMVILQSHVDMVCEKHPAVTHDFDNDPIQATMEDGWVRAGGTTLGADDGIGVASSMAVLASKTIRHGPLECLFTVDEESGMTGALGLQPGFLEGDILLNLDSEDEGEIFIGCAGGIDTVGILKLNRKRSNRSNMALKVEVGGLRGGHSGDEIHCGYGNAIKILTRFLWNTEQRFKIGVAAIEGGKARNAIPRDAWAVITASPSDVDLIRVYMDSFAAILAKEMEGVEPGFRMELNQVELPEWILSRKQKGTLLNMLHGCPHGVVSMSREIPGLVETSTNLASIRFEGEEKLEIVTSQRSSVDSVKQDIADRLAALFSLIGATVKHSNGYPGWKPDTSSEILGIAEKAYSDLFGKKPLVKAIHAGLECGLFLQKYPGLDMISFGPTIKGAHTPGEKMEIASVEAFWEFLLELLRRAPGKNS